jgi:hypothetical protein
MPRRDAPTRSLIDAQTLRAYRETDYHVDAGPAFVLRIDAESADLSALHQRHLVRCSAFLSAYNPHSRLLDAVENTRRHGLLLDELARRGLPALPGLGRHPHNDWPAEPSVLVPGLGLDDARALGERFEQNAVLWADADAVPRLILLR